MNLSSDLILLTGPQLIPASPQTPTKSQFKQMAAPKL